MTMNNTENPLVSVLINNYNYARYLPEAIDSVLNQTYKQVEIVIVDDGSKDESRKVIEDYAARHACIIPVFQENGGQAAAYNAGVDHASGQILCMLDSDDVWLPEKIAQVVEAHKTHAFVQHDVIRNGKPHFAPLAMRFDRTQIVKEFGYLYVFSPSSALSLTRSLAERIFPMPVDGFRICADVFVMLMATALSGVHTLPEPLCRYRIHQNNNWARRKVRNHDLELTYSFALDVVNRRLLEESVLPIPVHNRLMKLRMLKHAMRISDGVEYYVYGTSKMAEMVSDAIEEEKGTICAYVDSSPERWGTTFREIQVIGPAELAGRLTAQDRIVIGSSFLKPILKTLEQHGIPPERVNYWSGFFAPPETKVIFYGTGPAGRNALANWPASYPCVAYFVDDDCTSEGTFEGVPVYPTDSLSHEKHDYVFVVMTGADDDAASRRLDAMGYFLYRNYSNFGVALRDGVNGNVSRDERQGLRVPFVLAIAADWFNLDYAKLVRQCASKSISLRLAPPEDSSGEAANVDVTPENFMRFTYKGVPVFPACCYKLCVDSRMPIDAISGCVPGIWAMVLEAMQRCMAQIDRDEQLFTSVRPDVVLIPQGYHTRAAIWRYLAVTRGIRIIALENSMVGNRLIWENISGIAVNKLASRNYFWRWQDVVDQATADQYRDAYMASIKTLKSDQHVSPSVAYLPAANAKPYVLYIANVLTDSSVMFNSRSGSSIDAIRMTAHWAIRNGFGFVLKLHPRERPGHDPLYENLTLNALKQDSEFWRLLTESSDCVIDGDNRYDTYSLIRGCRTCVTICSQTGLEALMMGKETVLLGQAHYGDLGFTHEVSDASLFDPVMRRATDPALAKCDRNQVARYFYVFNDLFCVEKSESGVLQLIRDNITQPVAVAYQEI